MAEALKCVCGEALAEEITSDGVILPGGELVPFRRQTDYVICPECFRMYRATDLQEGRVEPVGQSDAPPEEAGEP